MRRFSWLGVLLLAACSADGPSPMLDDASPAASIRTMLHVEYAADVLRSPRSAAEVRALERYDCLVFMSPRRRAPIGGMDRETLTALRDYVRGGGRLLLLGYAARIVYEMGVEDVAPDRIDVYRWGNDQRTNIGEYRYGFRAQNALLELTSTLRAEPEHESSFLVGGGELVSVQTCYWEGSPPANGEVLGRLARQRDGEYRDFQAVVLTRWREEKGTVLAYGNLPEPWRSEDEVADNASQFLRNALASLEAEPGGVAVCLVPGDEVEAPTSSLAALPPLAARMFPGQVAVPHWGWHVATNHHHPSRQPLTPQEIRDRVLLPSYRSGASLIDLRVADERSGYPFRWTRSDPLKRPDTWWGSGFWNTWATHQVRLLAQEAHQRGMQIQIQLDPLPVRGGTKQELLAAYKWLARELSDPRHYGAGAVDGFGLHAWFEDLAGRSQSILQAFNPAGYAYQLDSQRQRVVGSLAVQDGNHGQPRGLSATGLSDVWRGGAMLYPPQKFSAARLDSRVRPPPPSTWGRGKALAGGSYADWILTQVNDFARAQGERGSALWWQDFNAATMAAETQDYVLGISMEPIKAAVAARLLATGRNGYRDILAQREERVQSGFGAESPVAAHVPFLQNNHFRLHGSGGPLWIDPSGLAQFRLGTAATREVAREFMVTRVRGFRPTAPGREPVLVDFIVDRSRGEGGYAQTLEIAHSEAFPATLASDDVPQWPREVEISFQATPGRYLVELGTVAEGAGILELRLDGQVQRLIGFRRSEIETTKEFTLPLAVSGSRRLSLTLVEGAAVDVTIFRMRWQEAQAAETRIVDRAGFRAALAEISSSGYFAEHLELITMADLPGFLIKTKYDHAARNVHVLREFALEGYAEVRQMSDGDRPGVMTRPFVLAAADSALPDLAVVPIDLPRGHHFLLHPDGTLVLDSYPRENQRMAVGFLWLRDYRAEDLASLGEIFARLSDPSEVHLEGGSGVQVESDLAIPWPRLLRVHEPDQLPMMVREGDYWMHRGTQVADGGGRWLRIYHQPDHPVQVLPVGSARLAAWPGPGSLHSVAIRDDGDGAFTVEVLRTGPLLAAPSIVLRADFDNVKLDGRPWNYHHDQRIFLPAVPGSYRLEARQLNRTPGPRVLSSRAILRECTYDAADKVLEFEADVRPEDGAGTDYFAVITGPRPTTIDGAVLVSDAERTYMNREDAASASRLGFVLRFKPGMVKLFY